jgi:hypothetical protein
MDRFQRKEIGMQGEANQLEVKLINGELRISIGIALLAHAIQAAESTQWPEDWYIRDIPTFASEMARELRREEEDGTTPVHRMLDAVALAALEGGAGGIEEGDVQNGLKLAATFLGDRSAS